MAVIYGLVSNRNYEIFYVGKTERHADARFSEHYRNSRGSEAAVYERIQRERRTGFNVYCEVLEYCPLAQLDWREAYWISCLSGLVNQKLSHLMGYNSSSPEEFAKVQEIRNSWRAGEPNWLGHFGVTYYPYLGLWDVQIMHWTTFYFLPRNYADGVKAVSARDQERERLDISDKLYRRGRHSWPADLNYPFEVDSDDIEVEYLFPHIPPLLAREAEGFLTTELADDEIRDGLSSFS